MTELKLSTPQIFLLKKSDPLQKGGLKPTPTLKKTGLLTVTNVAPFTTFHTFNFRILVNTFYRYIVTIMSNNEKPVMPVSVASGMIGVCDRTLRLWEKHGLINPARNPDNDRRLYSFADIERLKHIKHLLDSEGLNISGVKKFLHFFDDCKRKGCQYVGDCKKLLDNKEEI
ncbi:MAG: MerR family transcriptional regulator [Caldisericia bacterium]|nr:MerR family transcriptional regulator [Caldisericia bacterium]